MAKFQIEVEEILQRVVDVEADSLEEALDKLKDLEDVFVSSAFVRDELLPAMEELRKYVDEAEMLTSQRDWPFPSYGQILFSVN